MGSNLAKRLGRLAPTMRGVAMSMVICAFASAFAVLFHDFRGLLLTVPASLLVQRPDLKSVAIRFSTQGRTVTAPAKVLGRSGVEHEFALSAGPSAGGAPREVVVDLAISSEPAEDINVISFYVKVFDTGAKSAILAACPGLTPKAAQLAKEYGLKVVEARHPDELPQLLTKVLGSILKEGA